MLDFFIDNPIIVFILIGVISSIFSKSKTDAKEERKQSRQTERRAPNQSKQTQPPRPKPVSNKQAPAKKKKIEERKTVQKPIEQMKPEFNHHHSTNSNEKKMKEKLNIPEEKSLPSYQSRLIDGIILSEVLGPPRAKKRHRAIK
ncbi:hypothetical protein H1Z61_01650 [Bacillus aquiflavi]|uniref:Uncharacterized protein n=1 Tax=Bacillus aquiflavi TaxID=2672567 RepID=A0A6B3VQL5_9BACI|nr:hypothetical protein [Bacillus aquiflavi]MBA4535874.1 hypothetical protein [Bacillus aquiflavi]NEY80249.1 hypothetical protein [Bacillus aquiflavi]UAC47294.1 hypothetical protein K6959_11245 [Bacillus aquiflavi]